MDTWETVDDVLKVLFPKEKDWPELSFGIELSSGEELHGAQFTFQYYKDFGDQDYGPNVKEMVIMSAEGKTLLILRPEEKIVSSFMNQIELEDGTQVVFWKREPAF